MVFLVCLSLAPPGGLLMLQAATVALSRGLGVGTPSLCRPNVPPGLCRLAVRVVD
jgi:hypothetical protein